MSESDTVITTGPRIFYVCHDNPKPAGGIRTLYRHIEILNRAGFDARVLHDQPAFELDWFQSDAPVCTLTVNSDHQVCLRPDDWVVIPEDHGRALEQFAAVPCHKIVFCQNHFYVFDALPIDKSWVNYGVEEALVSSNEIRGFVESVFPLPATLIPCGIDQQLFRPPGRASRLSVCFMPRKGGSNLRTILGILWHRVPELREIPWRPIDRLPEAKVAEIMRSSTVFLSTIFHEGFGLPPLEAMACGCLPVGFKAIGAQDYANAVNGFWVPDEDPFALARVLEEVLIDAIRQPANPKWEKMRQAGYETAARYGLHQQRQAILDFWTACVNQSPSPDPSADQAHP